MTTHYLDEVAADVPLFATAVAAHREGRLGAARASYLELIDQPRLTAVCLHQLGVMATQMGDHAKAVELLNKAIALDGGQPLFHRNLAVSLDRAQRQPEALDVLLRLGVLLQGRKDLDEAMAVYRQILGQDPARYGACVNLGTALAVRNNTGEAVACLISGIALCASLSPEVAAFIGEVAPALVSAGILPAMPAVLPPTGPVEALEQGLATLGKCLSDLGFYDAALKSFRLSLLNVPGCALTHWNMSLELLARGEYPEAWKCYESRWNWSGFPEPYRRVPVPRWRGEPLDGKTIVVTTEQGSGDAIQFLPLVMELKAQGAQVIVETLPPLERLFRTSLSPHGIDVVLRPDDVNALNVTRPVDYVLPAMSLPHRTGLTLEKLPLTQQLWRPEDSDRKAWAGRLAHLPGLKVGVVWAGNPGHNDDFKRSLPLAALAPLFAVKGVSWVSLQLKRPEQGDGETFAPDMFDAAPFLNDFADTAAAIANLDLVISVDTGVAHLAASLGKPTWLLLAFVSEWRWLRDRDDSPWYPSARLFRQTTMADWSAPVAAMAAALTENVAQPASRRKKRLSA